MCPRRLATLCCMTIGGADHLIDVTFNVESDAGGGDPDRPSPTLRRYHQLLWSKPLPDGAEFTLDTTTPSSYLHHASAVGEVLHSFRTVGPSRMG